MISYLHDLARYFPPGPVSGLAGLTSYRHAHARPQAVQSNKPLGQAQGGTLP